MKSWKVLKGEERALDITKAKKKLPQAHTFKA